MRLLVSGLHFGRKSRSAVRVACGLWHIRFWKHNWTRMQTLHSKHYSAERNGCGATADALRALFLLTFGRGEQYEVSWDAPILEGKWLSCPRSGMNEPSRLTFVASPSV